MGVPSRGDGVNPTGIRWSRETRNRLVAVALCTVGAAACLVALEGVARRESLAIGECAVDDGIWTHIAPLTRLTFLNLSYTLVARGFALLDDLYSSFASRKDER